MVINADVSILYLSNQPDLYYRRKKAQRMQKYGTLNTTLDGKDQSHNDKVKPEKLELQGVMTEDSKVLNRMHCLNSILLA